MASLHLDKVSKHYGGVEAIGSLSLDIDDGEFVALVGPSGCGKSTLLRLVAGLEELSGGTIRLDGRVLNDVPPSARNIAMVFQNYALYPHMTVAENMGFALKLRGLPAAEIAREVEAAAAILGLVPLLDRKPRQLSGGQRQRVAMGRAIVRQPHAFLFDEPLSNLDAGLRVQMRTEIKALHQRLGTTTLYVTHDQVEAMTMADRIVVLRQGAVEQVGTPLELYDRPANAFVAGFIGSPSMNLLPGRVRRDRDPVVVTEDGVRLPLSPGADLADGQAVLYGLRPEHLLLDDAGPLHGSVTVVEPTGAETHIVSQLGQHQLVAAVRERIPLRAGQPLALRPRLECVHVFDAESGRRVG